MDTLILGCTHYPLLINQIRKFVPENIRILSRQIAAEKSQDYLFRHPEIESKLSKNGRIKFQTTEAAENFNEKAALFLGQAVNAETVRL